MKRSRRMPSEWTRTYKSASGKAGRVFTSLYGTPEDLTNDGYRRLMCNGIFWALGLEDKITADMNIAFVGPFKPNTFGNQTHARGIKPEMYAGFESPIPANNNTQQPAAKEGGKKDTPKKGKAKNDKPDTKAEARQVSGSATCQSSCHRQASSICSHRTAGRQTHSHAGRSGSDQRRQEHRPERKATQSSTNGEGNASKAIDGNKIAGLEQGGQTHTTNAGSTNPWWELDLKTSANIEQIGIWNREGFENRLDGFTITLLDADRKEVFRAENIAAPEVMVIDVENERQADLSRLRRESRSSRQRRRQGSQKSRQEEQSAAVE